MSVDVSFGGVNYSIPEEDDSGWADLTAYLVALSDAAIGTSDRKSARIATSTPIALSAVTDYSVGVNVGSASAVVLPAGTDGQIFVVFDASGAAATNNITITGTGGQLINGAANYVISTNFGAVTLQFIVSAWTVISAVNIPLTQNQTNLSIIDATMGDNTGENVANLESCTFTFGGALCKFVVEAGTNAFECSCSAAVNSVNCISDTASLFLVSDAGTGIVATKSGQVITVKNRLGSSAVFKIRATVGHIISATAWS
jgi:hypothetical protein